MADGNRRYKSDKKLYKVSFKLSEEDKRLLEEGVATNVNQIAKVVNTQGYGYTRDILAVKQDLEDVKRLMREVLMVWQSLRYSA